MKKKVVTHILDKKVVIITENPDGTIYTVEADFIKNVIDDWNGKKFSFQKMAQGSYLQA